MASSLHHSRVGKRAEIARVECLIVPSSSWPTSLVDQIASVLAIALVKDLKEHPIGELPTGVLPS
jgi:hypothetical protein